MVFSGGVSFPVMNFTNVVFPVPDFPVSTKNSLAWTDRFNLSKRCTGLSRYHRLRSLISISGMLFSMVYVDVKNFVLLYLIICSAFYFCKINLLAPGVWIDKNVKIDKNRWKSIQNRGRLRKIDKNSLNLVQDCVCLIHEFYSLFVYYARIETCFVRIGESRRC